MFVFTSASTFSSGRVPYMSVRLGRVPSGVHCFGSGMSVTDCSLISRVTRNG